MRTCVVPGAARPRPSSAGRSSRPLAASLLLALVVALGHAGAAAAASSADLPAPALSPADCPSDAKGRFVCGVLPVPLDHSGNVPGGLGLKVMVQNPTTEAQKHQLLVVLSGGPGQSGADDGAAALEQARSPASSRVVTIDQRGTGAGALVCPALARVSAQALRNGTCAGQLGDRRRFFTTRDTVADLELLRRTLGADRMVLMGTSYGTFVAQQYARIHPATTAGLILDSPVPAAGVEAFGTTGYAAIPQMLRHQCGGGRCRGVTRNPVADLRTVAKRLSRRTLSARLFSTTGKRFTYRMRGHDELLGLLSESDLNPYLRGALPAALRAAATGDAAPLARLAATEAGSRPDPPTMFSRGLNAATICLDSPLPYGFAMPAADREARTAAALAAVPAASYAPFSREDVLGGSVADFCAGWPADGVAPPSTAPIPATVPTVVLSGEDDLRTPLADARVLAAQIPGATLHRFPGVGHSVLSFDDSGCARRIVQQLLGGTVAPTGSCGASDNRYRTEALPPRRLSSLARIRGVSAGAGRIVNAVFATMQDAGYHDGIHRLADAGSRGGGLRGGTYRSTSKGYVLRRYAFVPGVRVTGRFSYRPRGFSATVRVDGPGRLDGRLRITPTRVRGTVGGVRLRLVSR